MQYFTNAATIRQVLKIILKEIKARKRQRKGIKGVRHGR
jgi:hypothetical protein